MSITKIIVENVKGAKRIEIVDKIIPNKPSLLVAPNGFGKTSITTAFLSLNAKRLKLDDEHAHEGNVANKPKLTIELLDVENQGKHLYADEMSNSISTVLDVHVINSKLRPKAVKRNMGKFTTATARLSLDEIVLVQKIPKKAYFGYSIADMRKWFGDNGKCLPNIDLDLKSASLAPALLANKASISKFANHKVSTAIDEIRQRINAHQGTVSEILQWIKAEVEQDLEAIDCLKDVADLISSARPVVRARAELLLAALQVCELSKADHAAFKAACEYAEYLADRAAYEHLITSFDTTWKSVKPTEKKGQLVVDFPNPGMVSNGQRDSLSFAAQVQRVRQKIGKRDIVLIVDEIFDYLDDANLVAAQYYISNLVKEVKGRGVRIYPLIFTHLNPQSFRSYAFQDQKIYFLDKRKASINPNMRRLISLRENPTIKDAVDRHFLHFAPDNCDTTPEFRALGLLESWGNSVKFAAYIDGEWAKYQGHSDVYDPFAVCCYVRIAIERNVHKKIEDAAKAAEFLAIKGTTNKLRFAISVGVEVADVCFLLGVIYNDGLHLRENSDNASPVVSKLENVVIRQMLGEAVRS